jgi:hypothetical protein
VPRPSAAMSQTVLSCAGDPRRCAIRLMRCTSAYKRISAVAVWPQRPAAAPQTRVLRCSEACDRRCRAWRGETGRRCGSQCKIIVMQLSLKLKRSVSIAVLQERPGREGGGGGGHKVALTATCARWTHQSHEQAVSHQCSVLQTKNTKRRQHSHTRDAMHERDHTCKRLLGERFARSRAASKWSP